MKENKLKKEYLYSTSFPTGSNFQNQSISNAVRERGLFIAHKANSTSFIIPHFKLALPEVKSAQAFRNFSGQ